MTIKAGAYLPAQDERFAAAFIRFFCSHPRVKIARPIRRKSSKLRIQKKQMRLDPSPESQRVFLHFQIQRSKKTMEVESYSACQPSTNKKGLEKAADTSNQ